MRSSFLLLIGLLFLGSLHAQEEEPSYREPFSFWWRGKIGSAAFEMKVNLDFSAEKNGCVPLSGDYYYPSVLKKMPIEGEYCPGTRTLTILRKEEGKIKESFSFSGFDGKRGIGIWHKENKEESVEIEQIIHKDRLLLLEKMVDEKLPEADLAWEEGTSKMAVLAEVMPESSITGYARGAYLEVFSQEDYSEYQCTFQLLPNETNLTLACFRYHYAYTPYWENDQDEDPDDRWMYSLSVSVWQYANGAWKTIVNDKTLAADTVEDPLLALRDFLSTATTVSLEKEPGKRVIWDWTGKEFKPR